MRTKTASIFLAGLMLFAVCALLVQSVAAQTWSLPQGTSVKDNGPRTYRFVVDYNSADSKGVLLLRQRVVGEYTRGLPGGEVAWKNVTQADAQGPTGPFTAPQKREFMEGFRYLNDISKSMAPDFFKGFPPTAVYERNLVWDTGMIEGFGQGFFANLKLNEPYKIISDQEVNMPGVGTFKNHNIVLEWVGRSQRNGQECALINYQAFLNPLEINNGGMSLIGRSDYWGQIWVSLATKQIEYGTLNEVVAGEMKLPGQETVQIINVLRTGTFEPVSATPVSAK